MKTNWQKRSFYYYRNFPQHENITSFLTGILQISSYLYAWMKKFGHKESASLIGIHVRNLLVVKQYVSKVELFHLSWYCSLTYNGILIREHYPYMWAKECNSLSWYLPYNYDIFLWNNYPHTKLYLLYYSNSFSE